MRGGGERETENLGSCSGAVARKETHFAVTPSTQMITFKPLVLL